MQNGLRLALLGDDEILLRLAQAAAEAGDAHRVERLCEPGDWAAEAVSLFPAAKLESQWESLLLGEGFDVIVVGRPDRLDSPLRTEQLRRLVQEGIPTMVVHPAAESIVLHELAMIQRDTRSALAAWNPVAQREGPRHLVQRIGDGGLGDVQQVTVQRTLPDDSREAVVAQLACDAELLDQLAGPLDRVTALAPRRGDDSLAGLAVTFAGAGTAVAQWTLQAPQAERCGQLLAVGSKGRATLELYGDDGRGPHVNNSRSELLDFAERNPHSDAGRELLAAVERMAAAEHSPDEWSRACRAAELAEAVPESLGRARTIELHHQEHSEQQTFKSVMAAGGCLLLLGVLAMLGLSVVVDTLGLAVRDTVWWRLWPLYLLAPVVLFLLLQILWRVFPKKG